MTYHFKTIQRRELPAFEMARATGRVVWGPELLEVTFHETRVDWRTLSGVDAGLAHGEWRYVKTGLSETILIGSVSQGGVAAILDAVMVQGVSCRGYAWEDRIEAARRIVDAVNRLFDPRLHIAEHASRGFLKIFDSVCKMGGLGLMVKKPGDRRLYLCERGD